MTNTTNLPEPLVPAEVDLRDFPFMPLHVAQLRPLISEALRTRQLNRWEDGFWAKYDALRAEGEAA